MPLRSNTPAAAAATREYSGVTLTTMDLAPIGERGRAALEQSEGRESVLALVGSGLKGMCRGVNLTYNSTK